MRILHVMQCANLGGMEQTTLLRIEELQKYFGTFNRLVSLNPIGCLGDSLDRMSVPHVGLKYRKPFGIPSVREMWRAYRTDPCEAIVMTGHNMAAMLALGGLCRDHRMLCQHFHHSGVKERRTWRAIYRVACDVFPVITFPSNFIKSEAEDIYPPLRSVAKLLRNPFVLPEHPVTEFERTNARAALGLPQSAFLVGNAGWLISRKRWDIFLKVAQKVALMRADAVFVIAGDGPKRTSLEKMASELGIAQKVMWLGWCRDMTSVYSALDVLLFNSDWDALGRSPIEALAVGVPVVASISHGGLAEIVRNGVDAWVNRDHNTEQLSQQVMAMAERQVAKEMVTSARAHIAEYCSPERDAQEMIRLLGFGEGGLKR